MAKFEVQVEITFEGKTFTRWYFCKADNGVLAREKVGFMVEDDFAGCTYSFLQTRLH
jgi:hypothetical protein